MTIFEGLFLAHLLGDWILQTEWQAQNKTKKLKALLIHVTIYHAIVFAVLYFGFKLPIGSTAAVVVILAFLHAIMDRRTAVRQVMKTLRITVQREPERWLAIAVDQALHLLLLGGAALYLSRVVAG